MSLTLSPTSSCSFATCTRNHCELAVRNAHKTRYICAMWRRMATCLVVVDLGRAELRCEPRYLLLELLRLCIGEIRSILGFLEVLLGQCQSIGGTLVPASIIDE